MMTTPEPTRPQHPQAFYERGVTPFFACRADERFSYSLFIPEREEGETLPVLVIPHDTLRTPERYRDAFIEWATENRAALLVPLFPAGIGLPWDLHAYKALDAFGVRYDSIVLAMLEESAERFGLDIDRVLIFGFSGGAQFTQRFLLAHPDRLIACSIGAPGAITLLDPDTAWWVGIADMEAKFGRSLQLSALTAVPVQTVVGTADVETWELENDVFVEHPLWMPGAARAGTTRVDRARTLTAMLRDVGVTVDHVEVPDVAHVPHGLMPAVQEFLSARLAEYRGAVR